jgi:hypothetical protein
VIKISSGIIRRCFDSDSILQYSGTQEESTPRYTQLQVFLLSILLSCLSIGPDIGLIHTLIADFVQTIIQAQIVFTVESM